MYFSIVFYERENSSLALKEKYSVTVCENSVLRNIFGPKRNEVTGNWRKFHNENLHDLYSTRSFIRVIKSRRMRWVGGLRGAYGAGERHTLVW